MQIRNFLFIFVIIVYGWKVMGNDMSQNAFWGVLKYLIFVLGLQFLKKWLSPTIPIAFFRKLS